MSDEMLPHIHLLSSNHAGWKNLQLIYEKEPAGEMPAMLENFTYSGILFMVGFY